MWLKVFFSIVVLYWSCKATNTSAQNPFPIRTYYFENKPFIYTENGTATGMVVEFFNEIQKLGVNCFHRSNTQLMTFEKTSDREEFTQILYRYFKNSNDSGNNYTMTANWFPIIEENNITSSVYRQMDVLFSENIAVIRRKDWIDMKFKFVISFYNLVPVLTIVTVYALTFGIMIWLVEHYKNTDFSSSFVFGSSLGCYLVFVTTTSVGYGDIAPKRFLGRIFGVFCMFIGLFIVSITTAIADNAMAATDYLLPYENKKVGALSQSFEAWHLEEQYKADVQSYSTYGEVLKAVQNSKVAMGVMNRDVASYMQDTWNDGVPTRDQIVVVDVIVKETPVRLGYYNYEPVEPIYSCLLPYLEAGRRFVKYKYKKHLQVTKTLKPTMEDYWTGFELIVICSIGAVILLGCLFDVGMFVAKKMRARRDRMDVVDDVDNSKENTNAKMVSVSESELLEIRKEMNVIKKLVHRTMIEQKS